MTESFPRQQARTRRFSLGVPRSFTVAPDGSRVAFLRSQGAGDPVTCLWQLHVDTGQEELVADPATLEPAGEDLSPQEKARRERAREQAGGIVGFATDRALTVAAFTLAGRVYVTGLGSSGAPGPGGHPGPRAHRRPVPRLRSPPRPHRHAGRLRPSGRAARGHDRRRRGHRAGQPGRHPGAFLRRGRVHRRRGDGPDARLLVGAGRRQPAGRPGGREPRPAVAYRRPGQPGAPGRHRGLPRGRHPQRRRLPPAGHPGRPPGRGGHRPRRVPVPGHRGLGGGRRPAHRGGAAATSGCCGCWPRTRPPAPPPSCARTPTRAGWTSCPGSRRGPGTAGSPGPPTTTAPGGC